MAPIKILLVDDHGPLRKALREGLQATGALQVIGEAATGREAVAKALELDIDVILMDVQLQGTQAGRNAFSGVSAAVAIRRERPRSWGCSHRAAPEMASGQPGMPPSRACPRAGFAAATGGRAPASARRPVRQRCRAGGARRGRRAPLRPPRTMA